MMMAIGETEIIVTIKIMTEVAMEIVATVMGIAERSASEYAKAAFVCLRLPNTG